LRSFAAAGFFEALFTFRADARRDGCVMRWPSKIVMTSAYLAWVSMPSSLLHILLNWLVDDEQATRTTTTIITSILVEARSRLACEITCQSAFVYILGLHRRNICKHPISSTLHDPWPTADVSLPVQMMRVD
jgi:hypothetical protein